MAHSSWETPIYQGFNMMIMILHWKSAKQLAMLAKHTVYLIGMAPPTLWCTSCDGLWMMQENHIEHPSPLPRVIMAEYSLVCKFRGKPQIWMVYQNVLVNME